MAIHNNVIGFERDLQAFGKKVNRNIEMVVKVVVFTLLRKIALRTPVDTGRAAGSWAVSRDNPGDFVVPENQLSSAADAIARAGQIRFEPAEGLWWIYNNLPYIHVLEFGLYPGPGPKTQAGFSIQAPQGMVRISVAEVQAEIDGVLRLVLRG